MIASRVSLMSPPAPYASHVAGRNCIGPCAPAVDVPRMRPMPVSTRLMAARYGHGMPKAASASW